MAARLEHANLTVPDIDAAIDFLRTVEPGFRVLHDAGESGAYRWVHIGTGDTYFALEAPHGAVDDARAARRYTDWGINHLGLVVDDIAAAAARLEAKGYREGHVPEFHSARIRRYFYDSAGFEWELVQYLTDRHEDRFSYS
ncbi:MAG TPA: VOC family protein [Thermohalobaculum sp.]|nr:VOC family protein [Thermohalobaculum sp.]